MLYPSQVSSRRITHAAMRTAPQEAVLGLGFASDTFPSGGPRVPSKAPPGACPVFPVVKTNKQKSGRPTGGKPKRIKRTAGPGGSKPEEGRAAGADEQEPQEGEWASGGG